MSEREDKNPTPRDIERSQRPWKTLSTIIVVIIFLAILVSAYFYFFRSPENSPIFTNTVKEKTQELSVNKLDGTKVEKELANRHPLAIIVENHPQARPQSGLDKASIVYEAITEGGITRFMAIYGPRDATKVGPVRSARTYFVDWLSEFNAFFGHVGGNLDALEKIKNDGILDLDQFGLGEPTYKREPDPAKAIEHTMYTNTDLLYKAAQKRGWQSTGNFESLSFRKSEPKPEEKHSVTIDFSESRYLVKWDYNSQTNTYLRTMGGLMHRDAQTGDRLQAANLIIQEVERWESPTTINEQGWAMKTIGTGKAKIFIEGKKIDATWKKTSRTGRTLFFDEDGKEIKFIPGQFWYEITPPEVFSKVRIEEIEE